MQSVAVDIDRYGVYFYINEAVGVSGTDPPVTLACATLPFKEGKNIFTKLKKHKLTVTPHA